MGDKNLETVTDWLQARFKDELKLVELRQDALLAELRMYLGQAPWIPEVQVTPPQDSPPKSLRSPGLSDPHVSEGSVGWVSRNGSQESALSGSWTDGSKGSKERKQFSFLSNVEIRYDNMIKYDIAFSIFSIMISHDIPGG